MLTPWKTHFEAAKWNPYYVAYARATGADGPEEAIERDRAEWPGGSTISYQSWIRRQWLRFDEERTIMLRSTVVYGSTAAEFGKWLDAEATR